MLEDSHRYFHQAADLFDLDPKLQAGPKVGERVFRGVTDQASMCDDDGAPTTVVGSKRNRSSHQQQANQSPKLFHDCRPDACPV